MIEEEHEVRGGAGYGSGNGYGDGSGAGSGYGSGSGYRHGHGDGSGYGNGSGYGYGYGHGAGNGHGDGAGYGSGYGSRYGHGDGSGHGSGDGYASGHGYVGGNGGKILTDYVESTLTEGINMSMFLGEKCLVRTYSAGVFFGEIIEKDGDRVIMKNSRQLWEYQCVKSISLSGIAMKGIKHDESNICFPITYREVTAIEILKVSDQCRKSIEEAPVAEQCS